MNKFVDAQGEVLTGRAAWRASEKAKAPADGDDRARARGKRRRRHRRRRGKRGARCLRI